MMDERKITQALLLKKLITESDLENVEYKEDEKITKALVSEGSVTQEAIALVTSDELNIPFLHVIPELIDWERWEEYASSLFLRHSCVPIFQESEVVIVMAYLLSIDDQHEMKQIFNDINVSFAMGTDESITPILRVYDENIARVKTRKTRRSVITPQEFSSEIVISEEFHDYLFVVSRHIKEAMSSNASQLHISIHKRLLKIYNRMENQLVLQDSYAYDEEWKTCIKSLQLQQPGAKSFAFIFKVEMDFFSAHAFFDQTSLIVINLKPKQNIFIDDEVVEEVLQPLHGLNLIISPRLEDIKSFAYALMKKSVQQSKITCSVELTKNQNMDGVLQISKDNNSFINHLKPHVLYTEVPLADYDFLNDSLVFQAVVTATTTDAFFYAIRNLPQSYISTALRHITIVAKARAYNDDALIGENSYQHDNTDSTYFIVEHLEINKNVRKLVWDQPKYKEVEALIPQGTIVQTLSGMLKNKQAHIDDLSLFM